MSRKIKTEQYEIVVYFKTQNCMSISAQFTPTNQHFLNESVELIRISKQTIYTCLQRKSQKNLRCQFQQAVEDGLKYLQIAFIVNFDFLPQFKQEIRLDYVQLQESIKSLTLSNMQAQISAMNTALRSMDQIGGTSLHQASVSFSGIEKKQQPNWAAGQIKFKEKNTQGIMVRTYQQGGYHYPFFLSEVVQCREGKLKISMRNAVNNSNIVNLHITMNRVGELG